MIRSPVPPAVAHWTEWHERRDAEIRADERAKVLAEVARLGTLCFEGCKTKSDHWASCESFWLEFEELTASKP